MQNTYVQKMSSNVGDIDTLLMSKLGFNKLYEENKVTT